MSVPTQFTGQKIKSIQRGVITIAGGSTSNTATITSVNTSKAICYFLGYSSQASSTGPDLRIYLTNGTTVTASRGSSSVTSAWYASYQVVEFI